MTPEVTQLLEYKRSPVEMAPPNSRPPGFGRTGPHAAGRARCRQAPDTDPGVAYLPCSHACCRGGQSRCDTDTRSCRRC